MFPNVRITANNAENSIVVYSNQEDYRVIERALREIDRPKLQVAIEATIAEVTLTDELQFGVQYFFSNNKGALGLLSATQPNQSLLARDAVQSTVQSASVSIPPAGLARLEPAARIRSTTESHPHRTFLVDCRQGSLRAVRCRYGQ